MKPIQHLEPLRAYAHRLPEVTERVSHGDPAFFVAKKCFAMYRTTLRGLHLPAIWCAASPEFRTAMLERDSDTYFVPPYVGHRGWLGVRLNTNLPVDVLENHLLEAYCCVAPPRLLTF